MNVEGLLAHYERVADAPDAVAKLRRLILDLAVRGKLVAQDPTEDSASTLVDRINAERLRLTKIGKNGKPETFDRVAEKDIKFALPRSWKWVPATFPAHIFSDGDKKVQTKDVLESGKFPVVDQGKTFIRGYCDDATKVTRVSSPIILFGDHTREVKLIDFDFVVGADGVKLLQPICLFNRYYYMALQWLPLDSRGYGRHFKLLRSSFIPLPPLAEQHRIVAKVDELMALCDKLEAERADREKTRNNLTAAAVVRLSEADGESFKENARFVLESMPALTACADQIAQLRSAILNLAVRGKLVPQDSKDEPASELHRESLAKRAAIEKSHRLRGVSLRSELTETNGPFEVPSAWRWARLVDIAEFSAGRTPSRRDASLWNNGDYAWVSIADMADGQVLQGTKETISKRARDTVFRREPDPPGTIIMSFKLTIGKISRLGIYAFHNEAIVSIKPYVSALDAYLFQALPMFARQGNTKQAIKGATLNRHSIANILIPLPPLSEQHRIVAKVAELMDLCNKLETALEEREKSRCRLLSTLLVDALAPAA